ncbi:MAG TPA: hypothetical protein VEL76_07795 [Gemmataceae bacterium]|nr:hypothetical protein [Gemmataceae bacterium]
MIYLNIDGYQRAFTFVCTFLAERTKSQPILINKVPILRLVHPPFAKPGPKSPMVVVEMDNMPWNGLGQLTLYREFEQGRLKSPEDRPITFAGDRRQELFCNPTGPGGALLFEGRVSDWNLVLDTTDIHGKRWLAVQLLDKAKMAAKAPDPTFNVLDSKEIPKKPLTETVLRIVEGVILYDGQPEAVLDLDLPVPKAGELPKYREGTPLPLRVSAKDPSSVVKVTFFLGAPAGDGKIPENAPQAEGFPAEAEVWRASLDIPKAKRGVTVLVSVQVTNGVGQTALRTIAIQPVDPKGVAAAVPPLPGTKIIRVQSIPQ